MLAASVGAGCKRGSWLQAWVLAARVGAGCKHIVLDSRKVVGVKDLLNLDRVNLIFTCVMFSLFFLAELHHPCWLHACHGGCERGCWLQARVLAASVGAGCKRGASAFSLGVLLGRKLFSHIRLPILT